MSFAQYNRLAVHVGDSDRIVIRQALSRIAPQHRHSREAREARHAFYREMIEHHHNAGRLFDCVATGDFF